MSLSRIVARANPQLEELTFSEPVACVYNPLVYAWDLHRQYLERFGAGRKQVVLLGMNPGPFGMVQTGVPFGEVEAVRSWLGLRGEVRRPDVEHEKRPVLGLASTRSEVSGRRLWGWAAQRFVTPQRFFRRFFFWALLRLLAGLRKPGRTAASPPACWACAWSGRRDPRHPPRLRPAAPAGSRSRPTASPGRAR